MTARGARQSWIYLTAVRIYGWLLSLYPRDFRNEYGEPLLEAFRERWIDAKRERGTAGVLIHFWTSVLDLLRSSVGERVGRSPLYGGPEPALSRPPRSRAVVMEQLGQDLRYAIRSLLRRPLFTVIVLLTLALGIGANSAIFTVVNAILLRPLPYPEPDQLVTVWQDHTQQDGPATEWFSPVNFIDLREENQSFEDIGSWGGWGPTLTGLGEATQVTGGAVSAGFFELLRAPFVLGRGFTAEEDIPNGPNVVVLSHGFWQNRLGSDPGVIGRAIQLNDVPFTVVGVLQPEFGFELLPGAAIWSPIQSDPQTCGRGCVTIRLVGRLQPGVDADRAQADVSALAGRLAEAYPETNGGIGMNVIPLKEFLVGNARLPLIVLTASVAFVLLVACANVANLMLARATGRSTEIAVRTALGAARGRVVRQLLTESLLLAALGGALGLALGEVGARVLASLMPSNLTLPGQDSMSVDGFVLGFTLAVTLVTGLLFGVIPALQASRSDLSRALRDGGRVGVSRGRQRLRSALVVAEVALAVVLLTGAGLFFRSLAELTNVDLGFVPEGVLTAQLGFPATRYPDREQLWAGQTRVLEGIGSIPGVSSVAYTSTLPLSGSDGDINFEIEGRPPPPPDQPQTAWLRRVTPTYVQALRLRLIEGRFIEARDNPEAPGVVVVNETMAKRYWPGESPIGSVLAVGPGFTIVGVVGNVKNFSLALDEPPAVYISQAQFPTPFTAMTIRTSGDPLSLVQAIQREVAAVDPGLALSNVQEMDVYVSQSVGDRRAVTVLVGVFASVAVLLASLGIYGLMNFSVVQRTHEIGVRITFGADRSKVLGLVFGQGMRLAVGGLGLGLLGAFGLSRFVSSLLYGVAPTDPITYLIVPVILGVVTVVAIYVPAWRATRVAPIEALRYE